MLKDLHTQVVLCSCCGASTRNVLPKVRIENYIDGSIYKKKHSYYCGKCGYILIRKTRRRRIA